MKPHGPKPDVVVSEADQGADETAADVLGRSPDLGEGY
jgi:hypothetical protein